MRVWHYIKSLNETMLMAVFAVVVFVFGGIWFSTHNATDQPEFKCPEEYGTSKEYLDDLAQWIKKSTDTNHDMTVNELLRLRNNELRNHKCNPSPFLVDDFKDEDTDTLRPLGEINFIGKVTKWMTYGRILVKNSDSESPFAYFIAEPDDVIEDGGSRYSPTTGAIGEEDTIKIVGEMIDDCSWNQEEYGGCVPWVNIKILQLVKSVKD